MASQGNIIPHSQCRKHGRSICPPCLFNCKSILPDTFLEVEEDTQLFVAYPSQLHFSWSSKHPEWKSLELLATDPDGGNQNSIAVNAGWYPLLVPQYDEQVKGVELRDHFRKLRFVRFKAPATSSSNPEFHPTYCDKCQLTWLTGVAPKNRHPLHHSLSAHEAIENGLNSRSLLVYVDARLLGRDGNNSGMIGLGVYFGKNSKHNYSRPMYTISPSKQVAELYAVRQALLIAKEDVIPDWLKYLELVGGEPGPKSLRLIVTTDSKSIIDTFTTRIKRWSYDSGRNTYRNTRSNNHERGNVIKHSDLIRDIQLRVEEFANSEPGVEVVWYHVSKESNEKACTLAKTACGQE